MYTTIQKNLEEKENIAVNTSLNNIVTTMDPRSTANSFDPRSTSNSHDPKHQGKTSGKKGRKRKESGMPIARVGRYLEGFTDR